MVIIKKQGAEFFDGFCPICHCEFVYQLEDVSKAEKPNLKDIDFNSVDIVQKLIGELFENPHVICPSCQNKVTHTTFKRGFGG